MISSHSGNIRITIPTDKLWGSRALVLLRSTMRMVALACLVRLLADLFVICKGSRSNPCGSKYRDYTYIGHHSL